MTELLNVSDEVRAALDEGRAVVALETTIVAHGFPAPDGVEVGKEMEHAVAETGATPATIGVVDGRIHVRLVGIRFLGTGGIGGVHRGYPWPPDVSADLVALVTAPVAVVCSGAKSLLDIPATTEYLETLGVPVLGYRTDTLPLFYTAVGGPPVTQRVDDVDMAARVAAAHWSLGACGLLITNAPPESIDVGELIEEAVAEAARQGVSGQRVTPFVLSRLHERSRGRTREVNRALAVSNARLAGEVSVAFAGL